MTKINYWGGWKSLLGPAKDRQGIELQVGDTVVCVKALEGLIRGQRYLVSATSCAWVSLKGEEDFPGRLFEKVFNSYDYFTESDDGAN